MTSYREMGGANTMLMMSACTKMHQTKPRAPSHQVTHTHTHTHTHNQTISTQEQQRFLFLFPELIIYVTVCDLKWITHFLQFSHSQTSIHLKVDQMSI